MLLLIYFNHMGGIRKLLTHISTEVKVFVELVYILVSKPVPFPTFKCCFDSDKTEIYIELSIISLKFF